MFRQFARDTGLNLVQQGWALIFGLLNSVVLARGLGTEDRGIYAVVMLVAGIVILLVNAGLEPAIIYFVAQDSGQVQTILYNGLLLTVALTLAGCAASFLIIGQFHTALFPNIPLADLLLSLFIIPTSILASNLQAVYRGLQDFRTYSLIEMVTQPVILVFGLVLVMGLGLGMVGAVMALLVRSLVVIGLVWWLLRRRKVGGQGQLEPLLMRDLMTYSLRAYVYNVSVFMNQRADVLLLNLLRTNPALIGIYDVAVMLAERFWTLTRAVSIVVFSRIAALDDAVARNHLTSIVCRYVLWVTLIGGGVLYLLADWLITGIYGAEFAGSALALRLLLPGVILFGVSFVLANDMSGRGQPHRIVIQSFTGLVVNVVVNLWLIPQLGFAGAALASSVSYSLIAILTIYSYSRLTRVHWRTLVLPGRDDFALWGSIIARLQRGV
jgi:O-antigen/teichoic acid export membrane protein